MSALPRVVVSAPSSGHGKTAVSVGLLAAAAAGGLSARGCKIGPDQVDAAYLGLASGHPARNLDPHMVGADLVEPLFRHGAEGAELAVVEGTMGLYDGLTGHTDAESTARVANLLRAPVVLVIDAAVMGQSVAAVVHGFRAYDETTWLGGVILNRVASERHEHLLREVLADIGVPVLGALPRLEIAAAVEQLPARSYGVVPALRRELDATRAVRRLGEVVGAGVDLDQVLALARSAPPLATPAWSPAEALLGELPTGDLRAGSIGPRPRIAVGYGYPETVELLTAAGAEIVPLDPLREGGLPPGVDALVAGGALPETYVDDLAANESVRRAVADLARSGRPVVAEGSALAWLSRELDGRPMCGVLDAVVRTAGQPVVGYREAVARSGLLVAPGTRLVGHKRHRTRATPRAGADPAWAWSDGSPEGFATGLVHASYLSLHWAAAPQIASRLVDAARDPSKSPTVEAA
jgi:cobyrinic acid a,c-diamide synthase